MDFGGRGEGIMCDSQYGAQVIHGPDGRSSCNCGAAG